MSNYKNKDTFNTICLGYENFGKGQYTPGAGKYNIPEILPIEFKSVKDWIPWSQRNCINESNENGLHFFIHDFQFMGAWKNPDKYLKALYKYKYVASPDFSLYTDYPLALQLYNHYRKHWLARYWQEHYINVIPTITWSTEESYEFCFDGEPKHSTIVLSTQSVLKEKHKHKLFVNGYNEMMKRLEPETILFYGDIPDDIELPNHFAQIETFSNRSWNE